MKHECESVFLFIAELNASLEPGTGTMQDKINAGKNDYVKSNLPELNLQDEEQRKDLHEIIWLERLYKELDRYFKINSSSSNLALTRLLTLDSQMYRTESFPWTVPVEVDASASMLQYKGILLNDKRLMEMTNVIGDTLQDPWKLEGMSRAMLKTAATPMLYGSSQACFTLWQNAGIKYTIDDVRLYNTELSNGPFGLANMFKDFIINNCNPKTEMTLRIWNDEFVVNCNRYRNIGDVTKAYKIWDSKDQTYNIVIHTDTKRVPDLEQFRRFFVTALIHNLDSQVANKVIGKVMDKHDWGIPIHDAFVVSPAAAQDVRKWYAEELNDIHANRKEILAAYFKSIGINSAALHQWEQLKAKVVPFEGILNANPMALK